MSIVAKYRLKEVAADFGVPTKEVADVISKYFEGLVIFTDCRF